MATWFFVIRTFGKAVLQVFYAPSAFEWFWAICAKAYMTTYYLLFTKGSPRSDDSEKILRSSNGPLIQELWTKIRYTNLNTQFNLTIKIQSAQSLIPNS